MVAWCRCASDAHLDAPPLCLNVVPSPMHPYNTYNPYSLPCPAIQMVPPSTAPDERPTTWRPPLPPTPAYISFRHRRRGNTPTRNPQLRQHSTTAAHNNANTAPSSATVVPLPVAKEFDGSTSQECPSTQRCCSLSKQPTSSEAPHHSSSFSCLSIEKRGGISVVTHALSAEKGKEMLSQLLAMQFPPDTPLSLVS